MSRIDQSQWNSKPKHEDFQIRLLRMIVDFEATVAFGEIPCFALRRQMIDTIKQGRQEIELCTTSFEDTIRYGQPPRSGGGNLAENRIPNHPEMIDWLNAMSIACKLANSPQKEIAKVIEFTHKPFDATKVTDLVFLQQGKRLLAELDNCRVSKRLDISSPDPYNF